MSRTITIGDIETFKRLEDEIKNEKKILKKIDNILKKIQRKAKNIIKIYNKQAHLLIYQTVNQSLLVVLNKSRTEIREHQSDLPAIFKVPQENN